MGYRVMAIRVPTTPRTTPGMMPAFRQVLALYPPAFIAMGTTAVAMGVTREDMVDSATRMMGPRGSQPMELHVMTTSGISTVLTARLYSREVIRKPTT